MGTDTTTGDTRLRGRGEGRGARLQTRDPRACHSMGFPTPVHSEFRPLLVTWRAARCEPGSCSQRNDPRGAAARRRPACLLCSRRPQHPCASTEPAHGLGRGRSAENGSVDRRPAALRGAVPRRRTGLGRAAPEAGEGQQAGGRRGSISASFSVIFEGDDDPLRGPARGYAQGGRRGPWGP